MATQTASHARPTITSLITGLLQDLKRLALQELQLARDEVQQEIGKAKTAAVSLGLGIGLAAVGGLLLILMLVHLLQALTGLPLWASYGIIGLLMAGTGLFLLMRAKHRAEAINVIPVRTFQTMKENAAWIKEEVTSPRT